MDSNKGKIFLLKQHLDAGLLSSLKNTFDQWKNLPAFRGLKGCM
jgi:hypothetical protein